MLNTTKAEKRMRFTDLDENVSGSFATSMGGGNGFANGGPGTIRRTKKSKKTESKKVKESIYQANKDDPNNPEVLISGYGRMSMVTLKRVVTDHLEELVGHANADNWEQVQYTLEENGVFSAKLKALLDAQKELEGIRKKGGTKSRGINKR